MAAIGTQVSPLKKQSETITLIRLHPLNAPLALEDYGSDVSEEDFEFIQMLQNILRPLGGFCRKRLQKQHMALFWTKLGCELVKLFKNSQRVRVAMLFLSEHMMEFNARQGRFGRMKCLKSSHRLGYFFDKSVILLHDIVEIFNLPNRDVTQSAPH